MIAKLRAGMMPPRARRRRAATRAALVAALEARSTAPRRARTRTPDAPAPQPRRVRARDQSLFGLDVDAGAWLPARHEERELRQHRRRADAVGDAARRLPRRRERRQPPRRRRPEGGVTSDDLQACRGSPRSGSGSRARRSARAAASPPRTTSRPTANTSSASRCTRSHRGSSSADAPFDEKIEVSVNGERVALLDSRPLDRRRPIPNGLEHPRRPDSGARRPAAHRRRVPQDVRGPGERPHRARSATASPTRRSASARHHEHAAPVGLRRHGPVQPDGRLRHAGRRRIFTCRPTAPSEARPCAEKIVDRLGGQAYRRPLARERRQGAAWPSTTRARAKAASRSASAPALEAILASPHFVFRMEETPAAAKPGTRYAISDIDLASRLSFFLWGAPPDDSLIARRAPRQLSRRRPCSERRRAACSPIRAPRRSRRASPRSGCACRTSRRCTPTRCQFPDFHKQLADAMRRETELFFYIARPREPQHPRPVHRRLHVPERTRSRRTTAFRRHRPRVPPGRLPRRPRAAGSSATQRAHAHVAREPHVAGAARQVGDGSVVRLAAAAAAAGRAGPRQDGRGEGRADADDARADGDAPREPAVPVVPPCSWIRSASRSTTST